MKKNLHFLLITVTLIVSISSCSIQKRLHRPGYHIEWNNQHKSTSTTLTTEEKVIDLSERKATVLEQPTTELLALNEEEDKATNSLVDSASYQQLASNNTSIGKQEQYAQSAYKKSKLKYSSPPDEPHVFGKNKKPKENKSGTQKSTNVLSFISFGLALLGFAFYFPALIGLFVGAIAIRRYRLEGDDNGFIWMPITAVVIGFLACLVAVIASIYLALLFSLAILIITALFLLPIIIALMIITT